ncbi:MAG: hypothetical protein KKA84_09425 [Bacteroidetes bacterium]|nr:hypothetical protein [Bacteroidota bacterium]
MLRKIILMLGLISATIYSQGFGTSSISDPVSAGMGNTYTSNVSGTYAIGKNPANILLGRRGAIEIATVLPLPNMTVMAGTDFLSLNEFKYFFGGVTNEQGETVSRHLTEDDKTRLKNLFDGGGFFSGSASVSLLNVVFKISREVGAFGFSINENVGAFFDFPESIVDLALDGNTIGSVYDFSGSRLDMVWMRDYTLTYARDFRDVFRGFRNLYIGASMKFVQGFAMAHTDHISTLFETGSNSEIITRGNLLGYASFSKDLGVNYDFDTTNTNQANDFTPFPSPAGSGVGFDFGVTAKVNDKLTLAFALTGLGSIKWNNNVAEYSSDVALVFDDISDEATRDSLFDQVTGDGRYISSVETELPSAIRFGASLNVERFFEKGNFPGTLLVALDYNQGLNNTSMSSKKARVSIGAEWMPNEMFPIRTGFSFGGIYGFAWSFGLGLNLGLLEFNISAFNFTSLLQANDAEKITLSLGSRWRF